MSYNAMGSYYPLKGFGEYVTTRATTGAAVGEFFRPLGEFFSYPLSGLGGGCGCSGGMGALGGAFMDGSGTTKWLVKSGDYGLSFIAEQVYGKGAPWKPIYSANSDIIKDGVNYTIQPGMVLTLPLMPGWPDPAVALTKTGNVAGSTPAVVPAGTTIISATGEKIAIGPGGQAVGPAAPPASKADGMSTGMMIGLGAAAVVVIGGVALLAKKKKAPAPAHAANRRRRHRYA